MNIASYIKIFYLSCMINVKKQKKEKKEKKEKNTVEMKIIKYNLSTIFEE